MTLKQWNNLEAGDMIEYKKSKRKTIIIRTFGRLSNNIVLEKATYDSSARKMFSGFIQKNDNNYIL